MFTKNKALKTNLLFALILLGLNLSHAYANNVLTIRNLNCKNDGSHQGQRIHIYTATAPYANLPDSEWIVLQPGGDTITREIELECEKPGTPITERQTCEYFVEAEGQMLSFSRHSDRNISVDCSKNVFGSCECKFTR
ncbi:MAG: hypothetical protein ACWA5Q_03710 [bacterium]